MARFSIHHHLGLKLTAVALATLLWLVVSGEQTAERSLRVPIEFTNFPEGLELVGAPPSEVEVRVRGSSGSVGRIAAGELSAVLDLSSARPGRRLFPIIEENVRRPFGVEVVQVTPGSVTIAFERSSMRLVPIVPNVEGTPAAGFAVGTVTVDPATVEVAGPVSALGRLTEATTEAVSVAGATESVDEQVAVGVADPQLRLRTPLAARVVVQVMPAPVEWTVTDVVVEGRNGKDDAQVVPGTVTVSARGPREMMEKAAGVFDAFVDLSGLKPGQYSLPVQVAVPDHVVVTDVQPKQVRVRVR
jgi:YbbR domain-containing protein